jgi:hypothetical protein
VILGEDLQNILEFPKIMFFIGSPGNIFQEIFATSSLEMHNTVLHNTPKYLGDNIPLKWIFLSLFKKFQGLHPWVY